MRSINFISLLNQKPLQKRKKGLTYEIACKLFKGRQKALNGFESKTF